MSITHTSEATIYLGNTDSVEYHHDIDLTNSGTISPSGRIKTDEIKIALVNIARKIDLTNETAYETESDPDTEIVRFENNTAVQKDDETEDETKQLSSLINGLGEEISRQHQSPINIIQSESIFDLLLKNGSILTHYDQDDIAEIKNVGFAWQIVLKEITTSTLHASHLNGLYKLYQIHCHWGNEPNNGSEHNVDGEGFAAEVHFVHYKMAYGNFENATKYSDGLAVLAVLLKENDNDNEWFMPISNALRKIPYKGDTVTFTDYNVADLIPENHQFWTYSGSLTTPPFTECVIWTVFRDPVHISSKQLNTFRSLYAIPYGTNEGIDMAMYSIINNVRPSQPLNDRVVRTSFMFDVLIDL